MRTQCTTEQQFIALYQRDCDDVSVFAATDKELVSGTDVAFSLELADGQPMLRGIGVVVSAWSTADNRFGRAGVHIAFTQLTTASEPILERLLDMRALAEAQPRKRSNTQIRFGVAPSPTALANWPDEESVVGDVRRSITGEHTAVEPSTGTPITLVDGPAHNTARYEGPIRAPAVPAPRMPARPPLPNTMGLAPAVALLPNDPAASAQAAITPAPPTPVALGAAPIVPVAVATLPQDAPTQPRAPLVVPPGDGGEPAASKPAIARGSSPSTSGIGDASSPAGPTSFARASEPVLEPSVALPIPAPPRSQIDLAPYPDDLVDAPPASIPARAYRWTADRLTPVGRRLAPVGRKLAPIGRKLAPIGRRLAPVGHEVRRASTWCMERARPAYRRSVDVLEPMLHTVWHSRARTPLVFAAGLLVGLVVSGWLRSSPPTTVASATPPSVPVPSSLALAAPRCTPESSSDVAMAAPPVEAPAKPSPVKRAPIKKVAAATRQAPTGHAVGRQPAPSKLAPTRVPTKPAKPATTMKPQLATKPVAPQVALTRPTTTAAKPATTSAKPPRPATTMKPQITTTTKPVTAATPGRATTKPATPATTAKSQTGTTTKRVTAATKPAVNTAKTAQAPLGTPSTAARPLPAKGTTAKPGRKPAKPRCTSLDCI